MERARTGRLKAVWTMGLLILAISPMGCYCTDWRWIWESDDECVCQYPPGAAPAVQYVPVHYAPVMQTEWVSPPLGEIVR